MFLSTRGYHYTYNYIVKSSKKNCENLIKKKTNLIIFDLKKLPSIKFLFFFIYIIFSGKIFMKDRAKIKFEKIEIGRFILSKTYCDFECYINKFKFYFVLIKNFLYAGFILKTCNYYYKNYDIKGLYVDHCMYMNGIIFSFFAHKKLPVYTNNYPLGIFFVDFRKNKNKYLLKYENALRIREKKNINILQKKRAENKISSLMKKKDFIPYLVKVNYRELDNMDYKIFDYIVYTHAFTDGQLAHGYDGFENNLEWLEFTLDNLIAKNQKILVKPHPNFYNKSLVGIADWDKKIFEIIVKKYKKYDNIIFLDKPIHNYLLLKKLNRNCILISKYGTVLWEAAYMNFKSICATQNIFDKTFAISNMWSDRDEYLKLLKSDHSKLKNANNNDLLKLIYSIFFHHNSEYNVNFYDNIIRRNLKLTKKNYQKQFADRPRESVSSHKINKLKRSTALIENKIITQICNEIHQVRN